MLTTTFWDPAIRERDGNILAATLGGRDNTRALVGDWRHDGVEQHDGQQHPVRRQLHQRAPDARRNFFGPEDVGIKMFSYIAGRTCRSP